MGDYEVSSSSDALRGVDPVAQVVSEQGQRIAAHLDQPRDGPGADLVLEAGLGYEHRERGLAGPDVAHQPQAAALQEVLVEPLDVLADHPHNGRVELCDRRAPRAA